MNRLWISAVFFAVLSIAPLVRADATQQARVAFESGMKAFDAGQYKEAEALFTKGYELSHKPAFLWNMAESAAMLGENDKAREYYHRYLDSAPSGQRREETLKRLAALPPPPRSIRMDYSTENDRGAKKPLRKKWWFWTVTSVAVVGGVAAAVAVTQANKKPSGLGSLPGATFSGGGGNWK